MKILMTGATGLLGRYFIEGNPSPEKIHVTALSRSAHAEIGWGKLAHQVACLFQDRDSIRRLVRELKPDVIIHAGGEGNVDTVEKEKEKYFDINRDFSLFLMEEAALLGARWIEFSSNAVYDGESAPYSEKSDSQPLSTYGQIKKEVDQAARAYPGSWVVFRPTVAYGWNFDFGRANPVTFFLPLMQAGKPLKLVNDQFENPVYAGDVARVLWQVIESKFEGEINVAGADVQISRYDWMKQVAKVFDFETADITPVSLSTFSQILVPRPKNTSFDTSKLRDQFKLKILNVREGAEAMKLDALRRNPLLIRNP